MNNEINWDRPMLERFKRAYRAALDERRDTFAFEAHLYVASYAKYLIEYLEGRLPK